MALIELARRRGFIAEVTSAELRNKLEEVSCMLSGLINDLEKRTPV